ncbi:formyltetrahydrofolate deformylase [Rhodococcus pyridinivorans]|uniref:formyltetrahydrofolate deformylase n=1 Tax=Rhodococcus pyridinivorans TaxID=103816 RepID=UPI0019066DCD|nr:formyltetrahydrofolate deformylase [Rhodococcus pyridinivorans]MCW3472018.1 formyltetrahydrofolate deformylase [Rhodococcus pyridinivorans]QQM53001.1 formyltetrahydrofolate deformylase [Rhodococcus pyridinivorans]UPK61940.1 formyltetrahydrofolate deformylase [Rhodococcus pyridinivorans]
MATRPSATATLDPVTAATVSRNDIARLLVRCPDRPGVVSAVSAFLSERGANIISLDQYSTDYQSGEFFQRTVFHLPGLSAARDELEREFRSTVAERCGMEWTLTSAAAPKRVAVMVSKMDHCLLDLLWRAKRGELDVTIGLVVSNHPDLADEVRAFGIPFVHIPVTKDTKPEAEERQLELLRGNFDLVVLARYMQIISPRFLDEIGCPIINIHHSFLPAFIGAGPYQKAKERGVKLVGATAHYVTEDLDEGPIIEQDVVRVSHRASTDELVRLGADVERAVLTRAVQWHCEDRVVRHGNTTIVF